MEALVQEREQGGPFNDLDDLCDRMYGKDLNRRAVESLIKCGALDSFGHNRRTLLDGYQVVMLDIEDRYKNNLEGQMNLFDELDPTHRKHPLPAAEEGGISAGRKIGDGEGGHRTVCLGTSAGAVPRDCPAAGDGGSGGAASRGRRRKFDGAG